LNTIDIAAKRAILFSARMRFSPHTQPVKQAAIDRMVEQIILLGGKDTGSSLQEILQHDAMCLGTNAPLLNPHDVGESLKRLVTTKRVFEDLSAGTYALSEACQKELIDMQTAAEIRLQLVVSRLFRDAPEDPSVYLNSFMECLCIIFSRLGETYVRLLKGNIRPEDVIRSSNFTRAFRDITQKYPALNGAVIEAGLAHFFRDDDPDLTRRLSCGIVSDESGGAVQTL
jgi:hypothetical protein